MEIGQLIAAEQKTFEVLSHCLTRLVGPASEKTFGKPIISLRNMRGMLDFPRFEDIKLLSGKMLVCFDSPLQQLWIHIKQTSKFVVEWFCAISRPRICRGSGRTESKRAAKSGRSGQRFAEAMCQRSTQVLWISPLMRKRLVYYLSLADQVDASVKSKPAAVPPEVGGAASDAASGLGPLPEDPTENSDFGGMTAEQLAATRRALEAEEEKRRRNRAS